VADDGNVWQEDLIAACLGGSVVIGLFLDGWNHINLQNGRLGSFFTPWHGLLYAGFTATACWVLYRNRHLLGGLEFARPQYHVYGRRPFRYPFALFGIAIAMVGMLGDAAWHTAFGEEVGTARVIAPFHLVLFSGAALLLAAPLRSGWYAAEVYPERLTLKRFAPVLISATFLTAAMAFMFQWFDAFMDWEPALSIGRLPASGSADEAVRNAVEAGSVGRVLVTNLVLIAPTLMLLRRWRLPFGTLTLLFPAVAALMASLTEFRLGWTVLAAAVGGIVGDLAVARLQPGPDRVTAHRLVAALIPIALWTPYFLVLRWLESRPSPFDLWTGAVGLCIVVSVTTSFLVLPAPAPVEWRAVHVDSTERDVISPQV
jgi:hypothetical protein